MHFLYKNYLQARSWLKFNFSVYYLSSSAICFPLLLQVSIQSKYLFFDIQWQIQDFEYNGLNLTLTKREELQHLKTQIEELSMRYIRNLSDDSSFLLFDETELVGLPLEFLKVWNVSLHLHMWANIWWLCLSFNINVYS